MTVEIHTNQQAAESEGSGKDLQQTCKFLVAVRLHSSIVADHLLN